MPADRVRLAPCSPELSAVTKKSFVVRIACALSIPICPAGTGITRIHVDGERLNAAVRASTSIFAFTSGVTIRSDPHASRTSPCEQRCTGGTGTSGYPSSHGPALIGCFASDSVAVRSADQEPSRVEAAVLLTLGEQRARQQELIPLVRRRRRRPESGTGVLQTRLVQERTTQRWSRFTVIL